MNLLWISRPKTLLPRTHRLRKLAIENLESRQLLAVGTGFLQGTAFIDSNLNNRFDAGEAPKIGATIQLRSADGSTLLATTMTNGNGQYRFDSTNVDPTGDGLQPGAYQIVELPVGYVSTGTQIISGPLYDSTSELAPNIIGVTLVDSTELQATIDLTDSSNLDTNFFGHDRFVVLDYTIFDDPRTDSAGQIPISLSGGGLPGPVDLYSFCTDLFNGFVTFDFDTYSVAAEFEPTGLGVPQNGDRVAYLYNHYGTGMIGGGVFNTVNVSASAEAAGLQLAIWELLYDAPSNGPDYGLFTDNFKLDPYNQDNSTQSDYDGAIAAAEFFLADSVGKSEAAVFLNVQGDGSPAPLQLTDSQSIIVPGSLNFANIPEATISGQKFEDKNGNGVKNLGDQGLSGWTVILNDNGNGQVDPGETFTTTDANGNYSFNNLSPGTYTVTEVQQSGWTQTFGPAVYSIDVVSGQHDTGNDFGNFRNIAICGEKFEDHNGNGCKDPGDQGLSGWTVTLTRVYNNSTTSSTTTTDSNGKYQFTNLGPGAYTVTEVQQPGWTQTFGPASYAITASSGQNVSNKDFGNFELGVICGTKFEDETGNGYSPDDTPLAGTKIYLDANNNGVLNSGEQYTYTAADGSYHFSGLPKGTYHVREVVPSGFVRTGPTLSDNYTVVVTSGTNSGDNDFVNAEKCDKSILCNITYVINGTTTVSDLRGNTHQGDTVQVNFTVAAGALPHAFTLVSYTAPGSSFDANTASQQTIFDLDTGTFGPGSHSLLVTIPNCFYQIDFVCGYAIDHLGPAGSNIFYSAQNRLFSADNGGTVSCNSQKASFSGFVYVDSNDDGVATRRAPR